MKHRKFKDRYLHLILGFAIPFLFFGMLLMVLRVYPFSTNTAAPYDAQHQYVPFLQEYRNKLMLGESMFFSKNMASTDFYLEWVYYLTSPFNLIILFFNDILAGFQFITAIKLGFIGMSMSGYLKKENGGNNLGIVAFSCAYALSGYVMSYYFNIMWLDVLMLFPWLIRSYHGLMENRKPWAYSLLLCLTIYSNFFLAMHVCIFLCIYFFLYGHESVREAIRRGIRFFAYSLLGGGMSAFVFLPFFKLFGEKQGTYIGTYFLTGFHELFLSFGAACSKNVSMDYTSNANIYCGVIVLILFVMYLVDSKVDYLERIRSGIICLFLFLCLNISVLDYFMNGFYKTNGYMGRYSYILIFFMVSCAHREFTLFRKSRKKARMLAAATVITLFVISSAFVCLSENAKDINALSIAVSIGICLSFMVITCTSIFNDKKCAVCMVLISEILLTAMNGLRCSDMSSVLSTKSEVSYFGVETNARQAILDCSINNEEIFNGISGVSVFSSSIPRKITEAPFRMGLRGGSNYMMSYGCELVPSLLYNIQYIYGTEEEYLGFSEINRYGERGLFKNDYDTSYAYRVPKDILSWNWKSSNSFLNINTFMELFTGEGLFQQVMEEDIFLSGDYDDISHYMEEDGQYRVSFKKGTGTYLEASFIAERPEVALCIKQGYFDKCNIYINNNLYMSDNDVEGDIIYPKGIEEGDKISVYISSNRDDRDIGIMFAYYDMDKFRLFADEFSKRAIEVSFDDNEIYGRYNISGDEFILVSVPSLDGWTIKSSGDIDKEDFPFLLFYPGSEGGDFYMTYQTPLFYHGVLVSSISSIGLLLLTRMQKIKRKI